MIHRLGDKLYASVKYEIEIHLRDEFSRNIESSLVTQETMLKSISLVFEDHVTCMIMLRDILMYLDKTHIKGTSLPCIYDLGLDLFREIILNLSIATANSSLLDQIFLKTLTQIKTERDGSVVDTQILKNLIRVLTCIPSDGSERSVSLYESKFMLEFSQDTRSFYKEEGLKMISNLNFNDYFIHVETRLAQEEARVLQYMTPSTLQPIHEILLQELITPHLPFLINVRKILNT